jgi:chromosome segregation ATPase
LKNKLKTQSDSHDKEIKSLNEKIISIQTKHNKEIQELQENLEKKSEEYNNKDKENRNKENQTMLERMNLKARIEELSNNIDSQNKEILGLKESNKKFKGTKESITEKDKAIKGIETKNKELEEKLADWEKTVKQVTREAQEKVDLEKHNTTLIQQNFDNEIKSHQDLKKN